MISFIWMTTVSMKYGNIESIKILFEPSKRVCSVKPLNSTSQNNTITWKNHLYITQSNTFSTTRKQTEHWGITIQHTTNTAHVKITHYIDDTERKTQINAAMRAGPSPAFHAISTKQNWRAIYNCRRTGCRQLNVQLNQINRFIKNVFQINFFLKSIKFSHWSSMKRFIEFK